MPSPDMEVSLTRNELDFIRGLRPKNSANGRRIGRLERLTKYLSALENRFDWTGINRDEVLAFLEHEIIAEKYRIDH